MTDPLPHDAHVVRATKLFRDVGFTLASMGYKRSPEALVALKAYNGVGPNYAPPFAWGYFPNAYMQDNWQRYYGERA